MAELLTTQDIVDGRLDVKALGEAANGDENTQVVTRTGETYPSAKKAIKMVFENGSLPAKLFQTKVMMLDSDLGGGDYAMVTDDSDNANNGLYYNEANAWGKSKWDLASKSFVLAKTNAKTNGDITDSINLYDYATAEIGVVIGSDGVIVDNAAYAISDYVLVDGGSPYTITGGADGYDAFIHTSYFDENKTFIQRDTTQNRSEPNGALVITPPINAYYLRFNINAGLPYEHERMLNKGSTAVEYTVYSRSLVGVDFKQSEVKQIIGNIVSSSNNMFDSAAATLGKYISSDGRFGTNPLWSVSDFISVAPNNVYTVSSASSTVPPFATVNYFTASKTFIRRKVFNETADSKSFRVPENAAYIRLNIYSGLPTENNRMVNKGVEVLTYDAYKPNVLDNVVLSPDVINQVRSEIGDTSEYITSSANLFDASTATAGKLISSEGTVTDHADFSMSTYINIKGGTDYTVSGGDVGYNGISSVAYYDKDKNFIVRAGTPNGSAADSTYTVTSPSNAAYAILNMNAGRATEFDRMFNEGSAALPYVGFYKELSGVRLSDTIVKQITFPDDRVLVDTPMEGVFSTTEVWSQYADFRNIQASGVYAMYESLRVQHPEYISKELLGNDEWGNPITLYKFKPLRQPAALDTKIAKVFLVCGTHGFEHTPPLATYLMLEQMCNNWQSSELLEALRFNVEFLIIPVATPSSWDDFTRKNRNGVDIARSFPQGFGWQSTDPSSSYYGGATPLQELESQYIAGVIDDNPDIDACYDFHNFAGNSAESHPHYLWLATNGGAYMQHQAQVLSGQLTRKWRKEYDFIPDDPSYFVGRTDGLHGAMVQDYAKASGIDFTGTFEVGERWWIKDGAVIYDELHCKTMMEVITNWMLVNLRELVKR